MFRCLKTSSSEVVRDVKYFTFLSRPTCVTVEYFSHPATFCRSLLLSEFPQFITLDQTIFRKTDHSNAVYLGLILGNGSRHSYHYEYTNYLNISCVVICCYCNYWTILCYLMIICKYMAYYTWDDALCVHFNKLTEKKLEDCQSYYVYAGINSNALILSGM